MPEVDNILTVKDQEETFDPDRGTFKTAFKDAKDVIAVMERLILIDSKERIRKAALIADRFNDAPCFDIGALRNAGQDWRHTASSGWLSSKVKRVTPNYKRVVDGLPTLTQASLREENTNADSKSQKFRERFTLTVRRWDGWDAHVNQTIQENVLYGYCPNGATDDVNWRPKFWRIDESFYPEGSNQLPENIPYWSAKENFVVHELASKLADRETSAAAGWNIENLEDAVNKAMPERPPQLPEDARKREDLIRDSTYNIAQSYTGGVKVIEGLHCYFQEPDGTVSYMLVDWRNRKELLTRRNLWPSMQDCLVLFSIEVGNGKLHGSKGMGRILYNIALQAEQALCVLKDNVYLGSMFLLLAKTKARVAAALTVNYPCAIVNENYEVQENKLADNAQAFYELDAHFTRLAEVLVGAFMPGQISLNGQPGDGESEKPTATEVNYVAMIEQEIREGIIARWFGQFQELIYFMQRKMFSAENIEQAVAVMKWEERFSIPSEDPRVTAFRKRLDPTSQLPQMDLITGLSTEPPPRPIVNDEDAVKCIIDLIKQDNLDPIEVYELGLSRPNAEMPGNPQQEAATMAEVLSLFGGDPECDRHTIKRMYLEAKLGVDKARLILLPGIDQTIITEESRQQLMEITSLMQGEPIQVSPRDNALVHLDVMHRKSQEWFQTLGAGTPQTLQLAENLLNHFNGHIGEAQGQNVDPKQLQPFIDFSKNAGLLIAEAKLAMQQAMQAMAPPPGSQPMVAPSPNGPPPPAPGSGPEGQPNPNALKQQAEQMAIKPPVAPPKGKKATPRLPKPAKANKPSGMIPPPGSIQQ